ncbi:MAG: hypothetical protein M3296_09140 [Actinomycetota bacterium]|nr:hypothetical protein [Actinomycetota bacterium]
MNDVGISPELLYGRWLHAHEEDTEDEMVFRPASADLPPSRGRQSLELSPDGGYTEIRPGRDDRPERASGHWGIEADRWLVVERGEGDAQRRALRIVRADGDAIVVRKPGRE